MTMMTIFRYMHASISIYKLWMFRWVGQTLRGQAGTFKNGQPFVDTIEHMVHIPHIQYETDSKKRMPPPQVKPRSRPAGKGHHWRGVGVGSGERALVLCSDNEGVTGPSTGSSYTGMTSGGGRTTEASITDVEPDSVRDLGSLAPREHVCFLAVGRTRGPLAPRGCVCFLAVGRTRSPLAPRGCVCQLLGFRV